MFPFALYLATGIVDAIHVMALLMRAVWGAPVHALQYVALAGALVLTLAGVTALFSTRVAAFIALLACGACWAFYLPGLWVTFSAGSALLTELPLVIVALLPVALLTGATTHAVGRVGGRREPRWMFTEATPRARDWTLVAIVVAISSIVVVGKLAIGTRRAVTEDAAWTVRDRTGRSGEREIEFHPVSAPMCHEVFASNELEQFLATIPAGRVRLTMILTSDFGTVRASEFGRISGFSGHPEWLGPEREGEGECPW